MTSKRGKAPRASKTSRASAKLSTPARRVSPTQGSKVGNRVSLSSSRYLFFGGKGGVGKTTAACATALLLLESAKPGESILLFSTDPAHSLSDSLEIEIGDQLVEVTRRGSAKLIGYEMNASAALEKFRTMHRKVLSEIAERGTLLDETDINELLNLSLPGMDEVMALFELSQLDRAGAYTHVVVDTAPAGHTSRLLRLPAVFSKMVNALDRMGDKHRYMVAHFAGRGAREDDVDLFLRDLSERIERVCNMLYDKQQTSFTLVAIAEALSVFETERYLELLQQQGVPVSNLIVNRVEEEHADCRYCQARVASQQPWLKQIKNVFQDLRIRFVPLLPQEVRGFGALRAFGQLAWGTGTKTPRTIGVGTPSRRVRKSPEQAAEPKKTPGAFPFESRRIFIFGGKGGVGKTTSAAAFALALARNEPRKKLLIFSTDPAHSLSDSFDEPVGELKKGIAGRKNLDAMEINPGKRFEELKQRYRSWTDELFDSLSGGSRLEIKFDREAMRELVELTPPGIDEIAALSAISDLLDRDQYHTTILDTAPTGHLIRFLELPQVALSWVRTFIKLLLKYQQVVHAHRVAEELVALSKSIKRVIALLTDTNLCEFVGVAIPERMSLEETTALADALKKLKVPMRRLLINGVVPEQAAASCSFCASRREAQISVIQEFRRRFDRSLELFVAPQQEHEIRGANDLLDHFSHWRPLAVKSNRSAGGAKLRITDAAVKNIQGKRKTKR